MGLPSSQHPTSVLSSCPVQTPAVDSAVTMKKHSVLDTTFRQPEDPGRGPGQGMLAVLYVLSFAGDLNTRVIWEWGASVPGFCTTMARSRVQEHREGRKD